MKSFLLHLFTTVVVLAATHEHSAAAGFALEQKGDELVITCNGQTIATYVLHDDKILRPHFKNVRTLDGLQVTRNHPPIAGKDATDHSDMHPGIWLAFGAINDQDFWRNKAKVEHERFVEPPFARDDEAGFTALNHYISTNGQLICRETCRIRFKSGPEGWWLLWDSTFESDREVVFGDQEEMGLGVRLATPLTVKQGGSILNSAGGQNEKGTWGKTAEWVDYFGNLEGKTAGVMLMPDPANFRQSWFHSRDYGLVVANPFGQNAFTKGEKSRVVVKSGERFRLRFGLLIHSSPQDKPLNRVAAYQTSLAELKRAE
ncbi:MAG: PmoA family protein [Verrucomicrobia bacterium]|nr:PmoA family protein [Verrucomicrobiota bacterium]